VIKKLIGVGEIEILLRILLKIPWNIGKIGIPL